MSASKLIGIVEAAELLGMHRSTLHLAIQHQQIKPDQHTPKGHVRFTRETIEAYRVQVRDGPAASSARPQFVQRLTHALAENKVAPELANMALTGLRKLAPNLAMSLVLERQSQLDDPWHVSILASDGLPGDAITRLSGLRSTHEFAYMKALRDGTIVLCYDTKNKFTHAGSRLSANRLNIRSYVVLPIKFSDSAVGVLELAFAEPREFRTQEVQFYSNIADLLAVAIRTWQQEREYKDYLSTAEKMIGEGLKQRAVPRDSGAARMNRIGAMLTDLAEKYLKATGAYTVICTAGPPDPNMLEDAQVRALADQCAQTGTQDGSSWLLDGREASGWGVPVPLPGGQAIGIAAGWKKPREAWPEDLSLLHVLAGACVLGLSSE